MQRTCITRDVVLRCFLRDESVPHANARNTLAPRETGSTARYVNPLIAAEEIIEIDRARKPAF